MCISWMEVLHQALQDMVPQSTMLPIIPSICCKRLTGLVMGSKTPTAPLHGMLLCQVDSKVFQEGIKSYEVGMKSYEVGTKSYGVGTKSYGVGTKSYEVGTKSYRVGNKSYGVGTSFIVLIEIICDVSFLKVLQLLVDGDIESNPGPTDNIENTPAKGKGRPKGTPKKNKGFRGTPRKIMNALSNVDTNMNAPVITSCVSNADSNLNAPIGLVNISNDCFFNSVVRSLFTLQSFRNHVKNFNPSIPDELSAVQSIKQLFQDMEAKLINPLQTHDYLKSINLAGYVEHTQFDAQECMTYLINLFYPRIDDRNSLEHNHVPDDCLFQFDGEESVCCLNCDQQSNRYFRESIGSIEFPENDFENSVQLKIDEMTNPSAQMMDEPYKCTPCLLSKPRGTAASQTRIVMNIKKYIILQLKTFGYDRISQQPFKRIPNLRIEEQVDNILLGKLDLIAIVYHIGDSPIQGHYVSCVKENNIWYYCNDNIVTEGVKLNCYPTDQDKMIPYLLIYEKDLESETPLLNLSSNMTENEESNHNIVDSSDIDFALNSCVHNDGKGYVMTDESSVSNNKYISSDDLKLNAISKTKSAVYKGYVICPNEDCNKHCISMLNSDEEVIECKNCGRWLNITYLELFPVLNSEDMNRQSVMNELKRQQEKIDRAEKMKKLYWLLL